MAKRISKALLILAISSAVEVHASNPTAVANKLYSHSASVRAHAADQLTAMGSAAVPILTSVICEHNKPNFDEAWPLAAKVLGQLKSGEGSRCLVDLLAWKFPPIGPAMMKSDETLARFDPAFAALLQIGNPAVPAIRQKLPRLQPEPAIMALRVLKAIDTPTAKEAAQAYVKVLEDQIRFSREILVEFQNTQN